MNRLPLLIVQMGSPPAELAAQAGEQADWFADALPGEALHVVRVHDDDPLPPAHTFRGAILSGSWQMVTDRLPWSERSAQWLRELLPTGKPVLGVCYGHQLMAHALGGVVDDHPDGPELGTQTIECLPGTENDPLLHGLPLHFHAHLTHTQSVLQAPPGVQTLARSAHDARQILRYGPRAWSVQFHPEFTPGLLRRCIARRAPALQAAGRDVQGLYDGLRETPESASLLRRFAALA